MKLNYYQPKYHLNSFNNIIYDTLKEDYTNYENLGLIKNLIKIISVKNTINIGTKKDDDIILEQLTNKEKTEIDKIFNIIFPYLTTCYNLKLDNDNDKISIKCWFKFE
jgi:hypothetical protein